MSCELYLLKYKEYTIPSSFSFYISNLCFCLFFIFSSFSFHKYWTSNGLVLGSLFSLCVSHQSYRFSRLELNFLASNTRYSSHLSSRAPELYILDIFKATELIQNKCLPWKSTDSSTSPFLAYFIQE